MTQSADDVHVLAPIRILLAEDDLVPQRAIQRALEESGYVVVVVNNGQEALDALVADAFDLVLMDVEMPEMSGWEATVAIREREQDGSGHMPILALTASAAPENLETCLAGGMDGFVTKPVVSEVLFAEIEALVHPG